MRSKAERQIKQSENGGPKYFTRSVASEYKRSKSCKRSSSELSDFVSKNKTKGITKNLKMSTKEEKKTDTNVESSDLSELLKLIALKMSKEEEDKANRANISVDTFGKIIPE